MNPDPFFATEVPTPEEVVRCAEHIAEHAYDPGPHASSRKVHATGIRWRNDRHLHPLLAGRVGTIVNVGPSKEPNLVEVYVDDRWLCSAVRESDLTVEDRTIIFQAIWGTSSRIEEV